MIGKLPEGVNWGQNTVTQKINEIIDAVNELVQRLDRHVTVERIVLPLSPYGKKLAKVEMLRACLDDLEDEIKRGSI